MNSNPNPGLWCFVCWNRDETLTPVTTRGEPCDKCAAEMQKELTPYKCSKCGGNNSLEYGLCSGCLAESLCNPVDVAALLKRNDELLADLKTCWVPISRLLVVRLSSGETETLTLNRAKLILEKNPTIRSTKPALNSLIVHAGDWFAYWKAQDRAEEERVAGEFSEKLKKEASSKKPHPLR